LSKYDFHDWNYIIEPMPDRQRASRSVPAA